MKKNAFLGIAAAVLAVAAISVASADTTLPVRQDRDHVMTDPCARAMNSPKRALIMFAAPPSERGLQCPIEENFGAPANETW